MQRLNLRSTHSNQAHYTIASGFTVTVDYDEHTRIGCFTQAEVDAATGGTLMCTGVPAFSIPPQSLDLSLDVDRSALSPQQLDDPYSFVIGEQIPLMAQIAATGQENISDTVQIELTVPRGLRPTGMTIQGEDQTLLDVIFNLLLELLTQLDPDLSVLVNELLGIDVDEEQITFVYDYDRDLVIGQPFPITLDVVGEVTGEFTVSGTAAIETPFLAATTVPFTGVPPQAEVTLQVVESECIGEVSTLDGVNARLRIRPGISSQEIASLASGTQVFLHDGYYDDWQWWWWRVTVVTNPNLEGYIRSDLIINDDGCERIEVEPPPKPPRTDPGVCVYEVPTGSSKQVWQVSLGRTQTQSHTLAGGTQFNVYGRSVDSEGNYLLLITDPHMESAEWRWVHMFDGIALHNMSEQRRACDYAVLAAFPFLDGTDGGSGQESPQYKNALLFYLDHFAPPILNASYEWHFNSQLFGGHHNGVDIVDRRPVADKLQAPFRVVAPHANGVIVDAGPDAFIQTSKVRGHFANISQIQPSWLADCRTIYWPDQTRYTGSCGRNGLWISVIPTDGGGVDVFVMFAMTAPHLNMPHEYRNDGWQGREAGLTPNEARSTLYGPGYEILCDPCTLTVEGEPVPGRQIIIQYDVNDDANANIEVVYLHVQPNPDYYEDWNMECSVRNSPRHTAWPSSRGKSNCSVGSATILGEVVNIGFTNGGAFGTEHLHYTVYIDWNDDGIFQGETRSLIDPLIAAGMIR